MKKCEFCGEQFWSRNNKKRFCGACEDARRYAILRDKIARAGGRRQYYRDKIAAKFARNVENAR